MRHSCLALLLSALAGPAFADDGLRDFCADRPGLGTPACTLDPGHVQAEIGLADWALDRSGGERTDTILAGDALLRIGLAQHSEAQIGWTAYGHVRDRAGAAVDRAGGIGDVTLALRRNLLSPDGSGTSLALMPAISLPVGGKAIGAGDWGASLRVPFGADLGHGLSFALTPEVDAAVDADRHGRHLAFGLVEGLGVDLSDKVNATFELAEMRDDDPSGHATQALAGLSLAWQARGNLQLDGGANLGLDHAAPGLELYVGVARRF